MKSRVIIFDSKFRNDVLINCGEDAAIVFVLGNINFQSLSNMIGLYEKVYKEFMLYAIGRNIMKYHRFLHHEIEKYEGKKEQKTA